MKVITPILRVCWGIVRHNIRTKRGALKLLAILVILYHLGKEYGRWLDAEAMGKYGL